MTTVRTIPSDKINLRLILVSGKTKEFLFSPSDSAGDIAHHVFENWPEDWAEEAVAKAEILRLIYQGRFLHSNVTLGALGLPFGKTTVMHLVPRENLPEPNSQGEKMDIASLTPQDLQRKLYFLVEQLQHMAGELPPKYQMRLPYELLSGLANSLLNDTIFEIVKGLMEIQHVTEKHLFQQRLQLLNQQKIESQEALSAVTVEEEITTIKTALNKKHKEELKQMDMKLVLQLDQKVADQQSILEKAGVPGFYVTNNPMEIQVQMRLCDFIIRLSNMDIPS
nr:PREDICTED: gonadal protein gdl-like isoform X1 [Linepithema humile]